MNLGNAASLLELLVHAESDEINDTAGVTPLVIVPGEDLDEIANNHGGERVEDGGVAVSNDIAGNDGLVAVLNNSGVSSSGLLDALVDGGGGDGLLSNPGEISARASGNRDTEGEAIELALESGNDLTDGLGGTGGGGNDVDGGVTGTAEIVVDLIADTLVIGVGVDSGHETADNTEFVVEGLGDGGEAVSGAGSVGDAKVLVLELVSVDTADDGGIAVILGGNSDDDLLGTSLDVAIITVLNTIRALAEDTGGFDNNIDVQGSPWEILGTAFLTKDNNEVFTDHDVTVRFTVLNGLVELAEDRVPLQKVSEGLARSKIVDGNDLEDLGVLAEDTEDNTTNTTETVNSYTNDHFC